MFLSIVIASIIGLFTPKQDMRYSNFNGSFTFEEMNFFERHFEYCTNKFEKFKEDHHTDTILYRLDKIDLTKVWQYGRYIFEKRYHLPYMDWEEINKRRGVLENKSGFQDF